MSYSGSQSLGHSGPVLSRSRGLTSVAALAGWLRLALGIAAVLLLVVFASVGERSAPDFATDTSVGETVTESEAVFDGRGKWGGYTR